MNKRIRITLPILLAVTGLTTQTPYVMAGEKETLPEVPGLESLSSAQSAEEIKPAMKVEKQQDGSSPAAEEESELEKLQAVLSDVEVDEVETIYGGELENLKAELEERHSKELESLRAEATRKEKELSSQLKRGGKELECLKGEVEKATEQSASLREELRQAQKKLSTMDRLKAALVDRDEKLRTKDAEIQRLRAEIDSRRISEVSHHKKPSGSYTTPLLDDDGLVADEVGCCGFKRKKLRQ